jgi:hypothetical protein
MGNLFQVKDKVMLASEPEVAGIVVAVLTNGKVKILWDRDWESGRTFVYSPVEIELSRMSAK